MNNREEGKQIKDIMRNMRMKQRKTLEQMAEELNVSRQTVSNWESGKSTPDAVAFWKLIKSYSSSVEEVRQLLNSDKVAKDDEKDDWGGRYCDLYEKTKSNYFNKIGPNTIFMDDFLEFVNDEVGKYLKKTDQKIIIGRDKEKNKNALLALLCATPPAKSERDIDYGLIMIELAMRLSRKGYIVNEVDEYGYISLIILDEQQRKQLDSIILEHIFVSSSRLQELSGTERILLKNIQSEYDQINQKIKDLKEKKVDVIYRENGFGWTREFVLSIGERHKDGDIYTEPSTMIHTTNTLEEMAAYLTSIDERIKKLVDNEKTFLVLSDNHKNDCCFDSEGGPTDIGDIKLYRVNCYDKENEKEGGQS